MNIRTTDLVVIIIYMLGTAAIGVYFSKRNNNTEEYFLGGRNFPGWAIGLSMIGTSISSITFLALPAAAFVLDWRQSTTYLTLPLICTLGDSVFHPDFPEKENYLGLSIPRSQIRKMVQSIRQLLLFTG